VSDIPIFDVLEHHAKNGIQDAVVCGDESITYAELHRRAEWAALALADNGVGPGDLVGLALPNGIEFFVALFAAYRLDATPMPLSSKLPGPEFAAIVETARPVLVVDPGFDLNPPVSDGRRELPRAKGSQPWKAMCSGGSTGRPKVIVAGRPARVDVTEKQYFVVPGDVVLVPGPLYHQGPFISATGAIFTGSTAVVMGRFDAYDALALIERNRVTYLYLVPTMIHRIWRLDTETRESFDLSSVRLMLCTGAPWAPWLKEEWLRWFGPERVVEGYGGTEEQGGVSITGVEAIEHPGSIGAAHDGVAVLDEEGGILPKGSLGELHFRTAPGGSHRYLGAEIVERNGWRSYGDIGYIGDDDYVYLVDRRTDMIVTGGSNVYPAELESVLESHSAVRSAAVIGLPDDDLGQRVHAIVDVAGRHAEAGLVATLDNHVRDHVAAYKVPRTYELVEEPLRDDAGKLRRSALRADRISSVSQGAGRQGGLRVAREGARAKDAPSV
jgi:bile acid-coenzyme A ligase